MGKTTQVIKIPCPVASPKTHSIFVTFIRIKTIGQKEIPLYNLHLEPASRKTFNPPNDNSHRWFAMMANNISRVTPLLERSTWPIHPNH